MKEFQENVDFSSSANFIIEIDGKLDKSFSEIFNSFSISYKTLGDNTISSIRGKVIDQAQLIGIINTLYNMRFSIISVIKQ